MFRTSLEALFKNLNNLYESTRDSTKNPQSTDNITYVSKERPVAPVSEDFMAFNSELFHTLTSGYQSTQQFIDRTVSVKTLYGLLERFQIVKEPV
jgi:hypothetical protein